MIRAVFLCLLFFPIAALAGSDAEFEATLRRVLTDKPEIIIEAAERYQQKMEENTKANVGKIAAEIRADKTLPAVGAANAPVTVIEFFDYNCGFCHKVAPSIAALVKSEKNVRWIFVDLPVLSPLSREAALVALAANKQKAYYPLHMALMQRKGGGAVTADTVLELAKAQKLDTAKLMKDSQDPETAALLEKHMGWAKTIGVNGTPSFIINDTLVAGAVEQEELKRLISKAIQE